MSSFLAVLQRELRAYFFSPLAWAVLTFFLLIQGLTFFTIAVFLSQPGAAADITPFEPLFSGFAWLYIVCTTPILTMRLISEEKNTGTLEILLTSPLSEAQMVIAKYIAALGFWCFLWTPTAFYGLIVERYTTLDWGPLGSGYLGVIGVGAMCLSVGIFCSSFSKNQIVAAFASFALGMVLFIGPWWGSIVSSQTLKQIFDYADLMSHMDEFSKGIVDSRRLVYYLTTTALFLFLTVRAVEAKKWR